MPSTIAAIPALTVLATDTAGLVVEGEFPNFLSLDTTANIYQAGCKVIDISTGNQYKNTGTAAAPVWTQLEQLVKVTSLSAANIAAMYGAPIAVVAAIPGKVIVVDSVEFRVKGTATQYANGGVVAVQYASTTHGGGTLAHATVAASVLINATADVYCKRIPVDLSAVATASIKGIGLFVSNASGAFDTGTGTMDVTVRYHLVD